MKETIKRATEKQIASLRAWLKEQALQAEQMSVLPDQKKAARDALAGRIVAYERVLSWLRSHGTDVRF